MRKTLIITDLTLMSDDKVCIAGIDERGNVVRPVTSNEVRRHHLLQDKRPIIFPRAKVEFDLSATKVAPPHIEDQQFIPDSIVSKGLCDDDEWEEALRSSSFSSVAEIFDGYLEKDRYVLPGAGTRSLGTIADVNIQGVDIDNYKVRRKFRLTFTDASGKTYLNLPINDLTFRQYLQNLIDTLDNETRAERASMEALLSHLN